MATISADNIKSVRIAPFILSFSNFSGSCAASFSRRCWLCAGSSLCLRASSICSTFSTPSKQRNAPPIINRGVIAHGINALMISASGTRITLLISDPFATPQTTGSSRLARTPETCCALSDKSSPNTPAVFFAASLPITEISSSSVAISSSNVSKLLPAKSIPSHFYC
ncbi:Uncharacterised protein [Shigella sonnei]|nr:hypothetical protein BvCmsHHP019_03734 [Escherichia coli]CSF39880.1 Uncharacterised protein [Shigella sonnei]CSG12809.1 Uncharacterised protein [Shigella sonnei]CSQ06019.1 Uncharacterised protein [Shigella sonnei]